MTRTSINMSSCFENPQSALISAFRNKDLTMFRYALEYLKANPDLADQHLGLTVFEKVLMTPKSSEFIQACIENGADLYTKNRRGRYPLHHVIDSFCPDNLQCFLKFYDKSMINVRYNEENCLHTLLDLLPDHKDDSENIIKCIKILLKNGCDPNMPNEKSRTPFFNLLRVQKKDTQKYRELVEFFMDNSIIDLYTYKAKDLKKMFEDQNPEMKLPEKVEKTVDIDFMLSLLRGNKETDFENHFKLFKENCSKDESKGKIDDPSLLYNAVQNNLENAVQLLVNSGSDVSKSYEAKSPPTFLAAASGFYRILEILLETKPKLMKYNKKNLLHEICHHFDLDPNRNPKVDYQKCLELTLKYCGENIDVNERDGDDCTPLHYAVRYQNSEAQEILLKHNSYIGTVNIFGETALDDMNKEVFEEFLDDRISMKHRRSGEEYQEIRIDYKFLVQPKSQFSNEIAPLKVIANNSELKTLILHPVLLSFIYLKWNKLKIIFLSNFAVFSLCMLSLVAYIVLGQQTAVGNDDEVSKGFRNFFFVISIIGIILMLVRELFQIWLSKKVYFKSVVNYLELLLIFFGLTVLFFVQHEDNSVKPRMIRVLTIILIAYELLQLVGALPIFNVSTHMVILKKVAFTFLKSIIIFLIPLVAFSLCFFILFAGGNDEDSVSTGKSVKNDTNPCCQKDDDDDEFNKFGGPTIALIKTFVMMTGEFDASALNLETRPYLAVIFVAYVFFGFMVIFNLLNAFAVDDTQVIKSEGELVDIRQRIEELNKYEKISVGWKFLNDYITILTTTIPQAYITIQQNSVVRVFTTRPVLENPQPEVKINVQDETIALNGIKPDSNNTVKKELSMDPKIIKRIRHLIEEKKQSKAQKEKENFLIEQIKLMKLKLDTISDLMTRK